MGRRFISAAALVACAAGYVLAAERATFILTNGERKSGELVFHGGKAANFIDGNLNLGEGGKEQSFAIEQVAVIDVAGGTPSTAELGRVPSSGQVVVMRERNALPGKFVEHRRADKLLLENASGQEQQYALRDVARVYLNPQAARTVFNYHGPAPVVGTTGANLQGGRTIVVNANRNWTDTGINVNAGDKVAFQASGEIAIGRSPGQTATADGNPNFRNASYPDPSVPGGALIGRIGARGKPFGIGTQAGPLPMPESGRLFLGVNSKE